MSFSARVSFKNVSVQECRIVQGIYIRWFLSGWISYFVVNFLGMIKFIAAWNTSQLHSLVLQFTHEPPPKKSLKMFLFECSTCETYRNIVYIKITRNTRFSFPIWYFGASSHHTTSLTQKMQVKCFRNSKHPKFAPYRNYI